jgi:nitroreductase
MSVAGRPRAVSLFPLSKLAEAAEATGPLPEELIRHVVTVATVAPSVYNTQPWRFRTDGFVIDLYADRERQLHHLDAPGRLLGLSCGATLHHARLALRGLGRDVEVSLLPDPNDPEHLARVIPGPGQAHAPSPEEWALLQAVWERRSDRDTFAPRRLTRGLVVDLEEAVAAEGCALRAVERPGEREDVAALVTRADREFAADAQAQAELKHWSRWEDQASPGEVIRDGIPRSAVARPGMAGHGIFRQRDFDVDGSVAARDPSSAEAVGVSRPEDPDVAALFTPDDTMRDWLMAGSALSALLLTATCAGASASLLNQPLDETVSRGRLNEVLRVPGYSQVLLRLGYTGPEARRFVTPRRPVDELLSWI